MEVNAATSNIAFSVEFGRQTVGIWVIGLDGKNLRRPFEPVWNEQKKERVLHPSWSPDGTKLVFCVQSDSLKLAIYDMLKKGRRLLTSGPRDEHPVWSPKGDWIVFTHNLYDKDDRKYSDRCAWLIHPDGSEQKSVADEKGEPVGGWWPAWNPEGTKVSIFDGILWFVADSSGQWEAV